MIDRRRFLTGAVTVAVAAVMPLPTVAEPAPLVLPASAALPVAVRAESLPTQFLRRWVEAHKGGHDAFFECALRPRGD
jgi:hypothetical protein